MPDLSLEHKQGGRVAGVDEAGRGPWAGPVVAAAVILNPTCIPEGINDSKKLSPIRRNELALEIQEQHAVGIGVAEVEEIARHNVLKASLLAMERAIADLPAPPPDHVLVDGNQLPASLPCPATSVIRGDATSASIAAASIIAKVTRDRMMCVLASLYPGYGWKRNAGYGTPQHRLAIETLGLTPHHRMGYKPIQAFLAQHQESEQTKEPAI